jgi:hypothetical protein
MGLTGTRKVGDRGVFHMLQGVGARRGTTAVFVLFAFIVIVVWVATRGASDSVSPDSRSAGSSTSGHSSGDGSGSGSSKDSGKDSPAGGAEGANGGSSSTEHSSELQQPPSGAENPASGPQKQPGEKGFKLPGLTGISKPPTYLFEKVPADASATGRVVKGYPIALIPAPQGTKVLSSEVTSEGKRVRAVFEGRCTCTPGRVFGFYQGALSRLGLEASRSPAVGGSQAKVFANSRHTVTLTVRKDGKNVDFSLFTVTTAKAA